MYVFPIIFHIFRIGLAHFSYFSYWSDGVHIMPGRRKDYSPTTRSSEFKLAGVQGRAWVFNIPENRAALKEELKAEENAKCWI